MHLLVKANLVPLTGFPTGVTAGSYTGSFDLTNLSSYSAAFLTANGGTAASTESALLAGLDAGQAYANIRTTAFTGGEIPGQLAAVPEPATIFLAGAFLVLFALFRRKVF
jgi:CHRD domain-containing protein/PEP-CTERM motif-containing protein